METSFIEITNFKFCSFMGYKQVRPTIGTKYNDHFFRVMDHTQMITDKFGNLESSNVFDVAELAFAKEWNWLIPVIAKCRLATQSTPGIGLYQRTLGDLYSNIIFDLVEMNFQKVYKSTADFVDFYYSEKEQYENTIA